MTLSRRSLITGLISFVAAPAIVRVSSIMPVKSLESSLTINGVPILFDDGFQWSPYYTVIPIHPKLYEALESKLIVGYDIARTGG